MRQGGEMFQSIMDWYHNLRTRKVYETGNFAEWRKTQEGARKEPFWKRELDIFARLWRSAGGYRLFKIGPGIGIEADYLNPIRYLVVEPYIKFIKHLGAKWQSHTTLLHYPIQTPMLWRILGNLDAEGKADGLLAICSLIHIPRSQIEGVLSKLPVVLTPNAIGLIVMKCGDGGRFDSRGRWVEYYQYCEFARLLEQAGFVILQDSGGVRRVGATWLVYFVQVKS